VTNAALFSGSAGSFLDVLAQVTAEEWELPGLGSWSVRSLAGHTARAILTVETYLAHEEPGEVTIASAEGYYTTVYPQFTDATAVAERGVEAGLWLGDDPVGRVSAALARTRALIGQQPANRIVSIGGMGILLTEYLRTRVFEIVVHTIDLSRAIGVPACLPELAIADTLALASASAVARGQSELLLMALTGRETLPHRFTVV